MNLMAMPVERMLSTSEMAWCLALESSDTILKRCRGGKMPGARRTGPSGHWRMDAEDFRAYLVAHNLPTDRLDKLLETP